MTSTLVWLRRTKAISAPESWYPIDHCSINAVDQRVGRSIPPGFRGLRTPLIHGGSIAWKSTARRGLLVAQVAPCDVILPDGSMDKDSSRIDVC